MRPAVTFAEADSKGVLIGDAAIEYLEFDPHVTKENVFTDQTSINYDGVTYNHRMQAAYLIRGVQAEIKNELSKGFDGFVVTIPVEEFERIREALAVSSAYASVDISAYLPKHVAACIGSEIEPSTDYQRVVVYHFGDEYFKTSVITVDRHPDRTPIYSIDAIRTDENVSTVGIISRLQHYLISTAEKEIGVELESEAKTRLRHSAKKAIMKLSDEKEYLIQVPYLAQGNNFEIKVPRDKIADMTSDSVSMTIDSCRRILNDVDLSPQDIDAVVPLGTMTKQPHVRKQVANFFAQSICTNIDPCEVTEVGAAVEANRISNGDPSIVHMRKKGTYSPLPFENRGDIRRNRSMMHPLADSEWPSDTI